MQTVNAPPPATTTTTITSSLNPSTFGQSVTFTATVTTASGTPAGIVTFFDGATNIGSGTLSGNTATFSTTALATGSHNITATYGGNSSYTASTSSVLVQVVNAPLPASTTTTITSSLNPSMFGQGVMFSVIVTITNGTPPGIVTSGTVTFFDGATSLGTGQLLGNTSIHYFTTALAIGSHNITAVYNGDATHNSSTSSILIQVVNASPPATTTATITSSVNPSTVGQSVTFTATVTSASGTPTGTVTFFNGATNIGTGTLTGNTATFTTSALTTGSHNITANYAGNASYAASTSSVMIQVVNAPPPATTTATITSSVNPSTVGQSVTFTATVTSASGTPTGTVTFFDGATNIGTGTLSGNTATFTTSSLTTGLHNITAVYTATATHSSSTSPVLMQIVVNTRSASGLHIYPNPVTDGFIKLQMTNMPSGNYTIRLLNSLGQTVLIKQFSSSGNNTETIWLGERITGVYHLELIKPDNLKILNKIIIY